MVYRSNNSNNANKRWILFLDINAAGNLVVTPAGAAALVAEGHDPFRILASVPEV